MMSAIRPSIIVRRRYLVGDSQVYIPLLESWSARSNPSESIGNSISIIRGPDSKYEGYDPAVTDRQS